MSAPGLVGRIVAPLVNTNEPESQVVDLSVRAFSPIAVGDAVCVLETSKSTVEVESELAGFTAELHVALNDRVLPGQLICEVFDAPVEPSAVPAAPAGASGAGGAAAQPRLTKRAQRMVEEAGLDLSLLPTDRFLTERDVRQIIQAERRVDLDGDLAARITADSVVIFGAGGHAKSLIDLMRVGSDHRLEPLCLVDDGLEPGTLVLGVPVAGGRDLLTALAERGVRHAVNAVGGIGRIQTRIDVADLLAEHGFNLPALVDPTAAIAPSATISDGVQVFAQATVWSDAQVGRGVIVNTGATVSHDCVIGDNTHIAPGAILAGHVEIGQATLVGMGVTTRPGLRIGSRCILGNGAVVSEDVPDGTIVSAGTTWPRHA